MVTSKSAIVLVGKRPGHWYRRFGFLGKWAASVNLCMCFYVGVTLIIRFKDYLFYFYFWARDRDGSRPKAPSSTF